MTPIHFDAGGTLPPGLNKVRNATGAPIPLTTRVAALDRNRDRHTLAVCFATGLVAALTLTGAYVWVREAVIYLSR